MTLEQLNACSKKELADKAKALGIAGFATQKKEDLVKSILRALKKKSNRTREGEIRRGEARRSEKGDSGAEGRAGSDSESCSNRFT